MIDGKKREKQQKIVGNNKKVVSRQYQCQERHDCLYKNYNFDYYWRQIEKEIKSVENDGLFNADKTRQLSSARLDGS